MAFKNSKDAMHKLKVLSNEIRRRREKGLPPLNLPASPKIRSDKEGIAIAEVQQIVRGPTPGQECGGMKFDEQEFLAKLDKATTIEEFRALIDSIPFCAKEPIRSGD